MLRFRKIVFCAHLIAGLTAGLIIGVMSFTGAAMAFEKEIVSWAERDVRRVAVPDTAQPMRVEELLEKARATVPDKRPASITLPNDPGAAVTFTYGRDELYFANPYTGELRQPNSTRVRSWLHAMEEWHRWLAMGGDNRTVGKLVNGVSNVVFCVLALTGLYIWWPRQFSWRLVRPALWFQGKARGKARDWNWHNVIGFWSAPILIVLTLTAVPISFRWASNGIYQLFGETPPTQPGPGGAAPVNVPTPPAGTRRAPLSQLVQSAQKASPGSETITLRLSAGRGGAPGRDGGSARPNTPSRNEAAAGDSANRTAPSPDGSRRDANAGSAPNGERSAPQAVAVSVREAGSWPLFSSTQYSLDPYTAAVLKRESYADSSSARKFRSWTRFLHTGEALGFTGKLLAGLASLGGVFLVYTGFALSWRRFFATSRTEKRVSVPAA